MSSIYWHIAQTVLRSLLKASAGAFIARGVMQQTEADQIIGSLMLITGLVWGIVHRAKTGVTPKIDVGDASLIVLVGLSCSFLAGCASYGHERPVLVYSPASTNAVVATEKTTVRTFLMMGQASKVHSLTKDGAYSRSISIGSVSGQGDTEMVKALVEAGGTAAAAGAKAAAKP